METKNWKKAYDFVGKFYECRARVKKDGKWGHVNVNGKVTTPLEYDGADFHEEGRAFVEKDERKGYVDKAGKVTWDEEE